MFLMDRTRKKLVECRYPLTWTSSKEQSNISATVFLILATSSGVKWRRFATTWKRTFWESSSWKRKKKRKDNHNFCFLFYSLKWKQFCKWFYNVNSIYVNVFSWIFFVLYTFSSILFQQIWCTRSLKKASKLT